MSKFITTNGITFKKTDLKRIERYSGGDTLYIVVAGKKDPICIKCEDEVTLENKRQELLALADS